MFVFYVFLFIGAQRFTVEKIPAEESLGPFMPFMISLFIIIFNSAFNIYVYHKYLPNRPFSGSAKMVSLVSVILFSIALCIIVVNLIKSIAEDLISQPAESYTNFLIIISILTLIIGIFIIISQLKMRKYFIGKK